MNYCFEVAGGMITYLLDSIHREGKTKIISMHHEQAAAFAAEAVARQTRGKEVALAMGTSGPGATNLITGIGSCWFDSIPCLFITGQVNTNELKGEKGIRQSGFQELDIVPMVKGITKYATQIKDPNDLLPELHKALSLSKSGRNGPVLLDLPNNVQRADILDKEAEQWISKPLGAQKKVAMLKREDLVDLKKLCSASKKPLILFGGGAIWADHIKEWTDMLNELQVPYVSTLLGQQRVLASDFNLNMIGTYGSRAANWAIQNCDLLLVIGARLDIRQTGAIKDDFARKARIIRVDIDPTELNNWSNTALQILADASEFMERVDPMTLFTSDHHGWTKQTKEVAQKFEFDEYESICISPYEVFQILNTSMKGKGAEFVADVGNNQMWAAHSLRLGPRQVAHYSGGMGAMGFGLPTAVGIALRSNTKTVCITGDGGMQLNIHELDTVKRLGLDLAVLVLNNMSLGMVKNFQDMYFEGRCQSTKLGYSAPEFYKIGKAYGIRSTRVTTVRGLKNAFKRMNETRGPMLIEVLMENATECRPRLTYGCKLDEQFPRIKERMALLLNSKEPSER